MEDELSALFSNFPSLNEEEIKAISEKYYCSLRVKKGTILLNEGEYF